MATLQDRVAIVTGAGRGVGRAHALFLARHGAKVVVNDFGSAADGSGHDAGPAQQVADEIAAGGGQAIANTEDVASGEGAQRLVDSAIDTFGRLDVLVNNAGILRDRMFVNMSDQEWDSVLTVHLRGHAMPTRAAARYWRTAAKPHGPVNASVINTTSTSGLFGAVGQTNYGAAKSGIASFTTILSAELERYGVRVNAIAPAARTRLTAAVPGGGMAEPPPPGTFDADDPANIAPFVGYLASAECAINGKVFFVWGGAVHLFQPWTIVDRIEADHTWSLDEIEAAAKRFATVQFDLGIPY